MVIKLDVKKTFDSLNWQFIRKGFNDRWTNWIMEYVMTNSMLVLVNVIPGEHPLNQKRDYTEDLISPYIFIICAKWLERYIHFMKNIPTSGVGVKVAKIALLYLFNVC